MLRGPPDSVGCGEGVLVSRMVAVLPVLTSLKVFLLTLLYEEKEMGDLCSLNATSTVCRFTGDWFSFPQPGWAAGQVLGSAG